MTQISQHILNRHGKFPGKAIQYDNGVNGATLLTRCTQTFGDARVNLTDIVVDILQAAKIHLGLFTLTLSEVLT